MLLTIWFDARKQQPCKMCNKHHLVMTILLFRFWIQNLPGGIGTYARAFHGLSWIDTLRYFSSVKMPMIYRATDFPSCQMPKCQATKLPKYNMTKPRCHIIELSNFQSCRAAALPSCRHVELPSCRAAKLPKCRAAICQAAALLNIPNF